MRIVCVRQPMTDDSVRVTLLLFFVVVDDGICETRIYQWSAVVLVTVEIGFPILTEHRRAMRGSIRSGRAAGIGCFVDVPFSPGHD